MPRSFVRGRRRPAAIAALLVAAAVAAAGVALTLRTGGPGFRAGFNVGGIDWPRPELAGVTDPAERRNALTRVGYDEARICRQAGGNMLRVFYSLEAVLGEEFATIGGTTLVGAHQAKRPVYLLPVEERLLKLDGIEKLLDDSLRELPRGRNFKGEPLVFDTMDGYLAGVERFNAEQADAGARVGVLVTLVARPPRFIIETPTVPTLGYYKRQYSFRSLWDRYTHLQIEMVRTIVRRYVTQCASTRGQTLPPAVSAFEMINEPDYEWLPDEMRIEKAMEPSAYPLGKYVTELHLAEIPTGDSFNQAYEKTPWGYQAQDAEWRERDTRDTPIESFRWGAKFDWYVRCLAEVHEHLTFAARDEGNRAGVALTIVSGSVTHNDIDYLVHMFRANPDTFRYVDRIGIHPYHWVRHDIWDTRFVSPEPKDNWRRATPRQFANDYFKRFDFLEEFAKLTRETDPVKSCGMAGKKLWITEFGIPTKSMGEANRPLAKYIKFIRPRAASPYPEAESRVWEDLWDAFLSQVDRGYLERHRVDGVLFYALRETTERHFDLTDDDRSNFAMLRRDGTPRMDPATYAKFQALLGSLTRD
jgi:hypothetical protein